ncbi:hypothetical protein CB1_000475027, partial [Camelus ferus]
MMRCSPDIYKIQEIKDRLCLEMEGKMATNVAFLTQENSTSKPLEWWTPRNLRFQKRPRGPYVSPLSLLDKRNLVESEMKHLGSPITTVSKLDKNPELGEDQAEEISDELMEFSLEDQEEAKGLGLKKMASLCDINMTQMLEEDSNQGPLIGDFSKRTLGIIMHCHCVLIDNLKML